MSNIKKEKIVPAKRSSKIISEYSQDIEETKDVSRQSVSVFISKKHVVIGMNQKDSVIQTDIDYATKVKQNLPIRLKKMTV